MKVLHICEYTKGGISTYINEVLNFQLKDHRISEVYLIVSDKNSDLNQDIPSKNIIKYHYNRKFIYFISAIKEIKGTIDQINPDILHVHSTFAGLFTRILFLFKRKRPKIVYCSHGWSFLMDTSNIKKWIYIQVEKILSLKTDLIINISKNELDNSLLVGLPKNKSVLIYNGISEKSKLESKNELNLKLDEKKINMFFIGRFDKQKGLDLLLNLFIKNNFPNINLYLAGNSVLKNFELNLPDNVVNLGWINNNILDKYYELFDIIIIPSRWEGFGLVGIEAMKNQKPLIVSNKGALPELVQDGRNGYVFDINNLDELKNILNGLQKSSLKEMGVLGYEIYKSKYRSIIMNNSIIDEYLKVICNTENKEKKHKGKINEF